MKRILLLCLLLAGCGSGGQDNNQPATKSADRTNCAFIDANQLCVKFSETPDDIWPYSVYEQSYLEVASFVHVQPDPGPIVNLINERASPEFDSYTSLDTGEITSHFFSCLKHEFVHYLLWRSGFPNDANRNHEHPAFGTYPKIC
jgi:hypothetical protein